MQQFSIDISDRYKMVFTLRIFFCTFLIAGSMSQYQVTDEIRNNLRQLLTQACEKSHAADKVDNAMNSITSFASCMKELMDPEVIAKEMQEAKMNGALDEVFRKYCIKSPQLKACINDLVDGIAPCIDSSYRDQILTGKKATDQLLDFICFKDGDRIAMFIAEGGPECFVEKRGEIEKCFLKAKTAVDSAVERENNTLTIDEQCAKYDELSACMVRALEACSTPTPGNMIESLCRYVRNGLPCKNQR